MIKYCALSAIVCGIILVPSCKKNRSSSTNPSYTYLSSATITKGPDTVLFLAAGPLWVTAVNSSGECEFSATDTLAGGVVSRITITIFNYGGVGGYVFDSVSRSYGTYEIISPAYQQTTFAHGTIHITKVTGQAISGTFSGNLVDGTMVSNGVFTASNRRY